MVFLAEGCDFLFKPHKGATAHAGARTVPALVKRVRPAKWRSEHATRMSKSTADHDDSLLKHVSHCRPSCYCREAGAVAPKDDRLRVP